MQVPLYVIAVLFWLFGAVAVAATRTDIQVIVAVLCFGFGTLTIGMAGMIGALKRRGEP